MARAKRQSTNIDLLIIGGGINGLGIAADAAARGLSVLLVVEKEDFGSGTTSASSRLIHGGLRYLQHRDLSLVRESLRERGLLLRRRPELVRLLPLLIPTFRRYPPSRLVVAAGLRLYDLLARDPAFPRSRALSAAAVRQREPGLARLGMTGGFVYHDAQLEFPERLCVALMREARAAGAELLNHTRVTAIHQRQGRITGVSLQDELTGAEREVESSVVINAAGPWVDAVNRLLDPEGAQIPPLLGGTWGTHLVLPALPEGPCGAVYAVARQDGRPFFLLPWDGRLLAGTTDVPLRGSPDNLKPQPWEIEYLLAETNRLFPACAYEASDIQFTTIGVRPLPAPAEGKVTTAGAITRRHFMIDHRRHGLRGLVSVVGGKLTTYRSLAEEVVDWSLRLLRRPRVPCPTAALPDRPPAPELELAAAVDLARLKLPEAVAPRLVGLYGERWREVLALARRDPALARPLIPGCPALAAEVIHAMEEEQARTVDDILFRRLMLLPPGRELRSAVERLAYRVEV